MIALPLAETNAAATLAQLRQAASAEAFFDILGVASDPAVLTRARLHVLRRMGAYLAGVDLAALPPETAVARARATLLKAHNDFVTSSPLQERVFKVLRDRAPGAPRGGGAFVPFDDLLVSADLPGR